MRTSTRPVGVLFLCLFEYSKLTEESSHGKSELLIYT